jgi:hypothetical protein
VAHNNISIRFRFFKIPVTWELGTSPKTGPFLCGRQARQSPEKVRLSELDGWQCRDEFLGLPENDLKRLAEFLNKVGLWSTDAEAYGFDSSRFPLYVYLDDVQQFRTDLRDALLHQKSFMSAVTPETTRPPKTLLDLMSQSHPANNFALRFELSKVAAGVVTITNARQMLFATTLADVASGIRFKTCGRKDCGKTFPLKSEHKRKFCSQYCGHLVSQRQKRAAERKQKRARKSSR